MLLRIFFYFSLHICFSICNFPLASEDIANLAWIPVSPIGAQVNVRFYQTSVLTQNNTVLVYSGMYSNKGTVTPDPSLSKLEISTWTWKKVNASGTPPSPPRAGHTAVLLPDNRMIIFGGTVILYDYNTIYMYDCNTDSWIDGYPDKVQGSPPQKRAGATMVLDTVNQHAVLFGGYKYTDQKYFNDVWRYDYINDYWMHVDANGTLPTPVASHSAVYLASRHSMLIIGGYTFSDTTTTQMALFSFDSDTWEILSVPGTPSRAVMGYAALNSHSFIFYAGVGDDRTFFGDLLLFNFDQLLWSNITATEEFGAPMPRGSPTFLVYGNNTGIIVCQGGTYGYSVLDLNPANDTFVLRIDGLFNSSLTGTTSGNSDIGMESMDGQSKKLSGGGIAGIVIGVVAFCATVAIVVFYVWRKYSRRGITEDDVEMETAFDRIQAIRDVKIMERLGGGNFGAVYRGIWNGMTEVALKEIKDDNLEEFRHEASVLQNLACPHVVQFYGIYRDEEGRGYLVMEFMSKGSLLNLIQTERTNLSTSDLLFMARQAAAGMHYLESKNIIHRDLALRNLLVTIHGSDTQKYLVKVGDFGLSKETPQGIYQASSTKTIPVKWSSPEVLLQRMYTSKADVWSFGITLYELFGYGAMPYPVLSNAEVLEKLKEGYRMPKLPDMDEDVYSIMLECWAEDPAKRPNFRTIYDKLNALCARHGRISVGKLAPLILEVDNETLYN